MAHLDFAISAHYSLPKNFKADIVVHNPHQVTPKIFNWIQVLVPFQNLNLLVMPFFCWLGCMFWVMMKDEVPLHFQLSRRSLKVLFFFCQLFTISSTLYKAPVPAEKKQHHSRMLPPPCFSLGVVFFWWCAGMFLRQTFGIMAKKKGKTWRGKAYLNSWNSFLVNHRHFKLYHVRDDYYLA